MGISLSGVTQSSTGNLTISAGSGNDVLIGNGSTQLFIDGGNDHIGVGAAPSDQDMLIVHGTNSASDARRNFRVAGTVNVVAGSNGQMATIGGTLVEAGSGTHTNFSTLALAPVTTTSGSATVTDAATLWIIGAPSGTVSGANYALWVDDGAVRFDDRTFSIGGIAYEFPANNGDADQLLTTDGSGNLSWAAATGVAAGAGTTGKISKWTSSSAVGDSVMAEAGGNIGIDVIPANTWHSAQSSLFIGTERNVIHGDASNILYITNNGYVNTGNAWKYTAGSGATNYYAFNGIHHFRVAASGLADATITWTEAMTILADGKVGIGTAAPDNLLHITDASAGSVAGHADALLVLESDASTYINLLGSNTGVLGLMFGSATGGNNDGQLFYEPNANRWSFSSGTNNHFMRMDSSNVVFNSAETISTTAGNLTLSAATGADVIIGDNANILYVDGGTDSVFIGVASAAVAAKLLIESSGTGFQSQISVTNPQAHAAGVGHAINFYGGSGDQNMAAIQVAWVGSSASNGAYMQFATRQVSDGALVARMHIDTAGKVGIGITQPATPLHVYHASDNTLGVFESGDATTVVKIKDSNSDATYPPQLQTAGNVIKLQGGTSAGQGAGYVSVAANGNTKIELTANSGTAFSGMIGNDTYYQIGTRLTNATSTTHNFATAAYTIASASNARPRLALFSSHTLNYTGTTTVTDVVRSVEILERTIVGQGGTVNISTSLAVTAPTEGSNVTLLNNSAINIATGAGTPTNLYGLYINAQTGGTSTNYAIYTAGTTNSYFGGNVGLGSAPPANSGFWLENNNSSRGLYLNDVSQSTGNELWSIRNEGTLLKFKTHADNTVSTTLNVVTLARDGNVGIGATSPHGGHADADGANLDIQGNFALVLGSDHDAATRTDDEIKNTRIGLVHYDNDQEPMTMMWGEVQNTYSQVTIGGGSSWMNAVEEIRFYTATNTTTTGGTLRAKITDAGDLSLENNDLLNVGNSGSDWTAGTLQVTGNNANSQLILESYTTTAGGGPYINLNRSNHASAHTAVDQDDALGQINFRGSDTNSFQTGARIIAFADETWTDGAAHGSRLQFYTVDNTTTTLDPRMIIDQNGNVGIGESAPLAKLVVGDSVGGTGTTGTYATAALLYGTSGTNTGSLYINDTTGTGTTAGVGGKIVFGSRITSSTYEISASIQGFKENATSNNFAGGLKFRTVANGANEAVAMTIASDGKVGIGDTTPDYSLVVEKTTTRVEIGHGPTIATKVMGEPSRWSMYRANNTIASPTAVASGEIMGELYFGGYRTTGGSPGYFQSAAIKGVAEGTVGSSRLPARLEFWTAADAASSLLTKRMDIDSSGNIHFGSAGTNQDVRFYGDTSGDDMRWDAGANALLIDDDVYVAFGNNEDLKIYHDGSNSYIHDQGTGVLALRGSAIYLNNPGNGENMLGAIADGAVTLYYDNAAKLATTSTGVSVTGALSTTSHIYLSDSQILYLGTGNDLRIYHDGSNSYIDDEGTGDLYLRYYGSFRVAQNSNNELSILATVDAGVGLYYNGNEKLVTTNTGVTVTGEVVYTDTSAELMTDALMFG